MCVCVCVCVLGGGGVQMIFLVASRGGGGHSIYIL